MPETLDEAIGRLRDLALAAVTDDNEAVVLALVCIADTLYGLLALQRDAFDREHARGPA